MPRGGYHPHADRWGRKSAWNNGSVTKTIRVPEALADRVLDIAHKLDEGENIDCDTKANEQVSVLKAELEQLRSERDQLDREVNELHAKVGDLDLELTNLKEQQSQQQADAPNHEQLPSGLEAIRDRVLSRWKVQKRAESKERIKEALDKFIAAIR